jgi:hypothetical protein
MPFFKLKHSAELKSGDAIKCHWRHGALHALAFRQALNTFRQQR